MKAADSLQVCAGPEVGAKAAIHAVDDIFKDHTTRSCFSNIRGKRI